MSIKIPRLTLALLVALAGGSAASATAEDRPPQPSPQPSAEAGGETELGTVTVSASALSLGSDDMSVPVSVLAGDELVQRREASLGETLAREPGITSTHFGAGASRPIIRGMDGARVKVLTDGAEVMDASTISPDHAVAVEPMLSEQIEVLRGPSALAYGGGAIGGVVNVLDRRVPAAIPARGVEGSVEVRGNTAAREAAGAFEVTAGAGKVAIHAEGLQRDARDYRVGSGWPGGSRVDGSFNETQTGSVGLSWIDTHGFLGLAYTQQSNEYGLPGHNHGIEECEAVGNLLECGDHEEDEPGEAGEAAPFVKLDSARWDLRGEYLEPIAGFAKVRLRASRTDYRHDEIEDGAVATRFRNQAHDGRVELEHHPFSGWRGVVGLQTTRRDFRALGEEAYVPPTLTRRHAAFVVEEFKTGNWRFEAGLRHEWQDIDVDAEAPDRRHRGNSASLGTVWNFAPQYALGASLSRAQRLPTAEELYAQGLHLATATFERGNADLDAETSHNLDISLRKLGGDTTFALSVFRNRVSDFIFARTIDERDGLQLVEYAQRDVNFTGLEGQIRQQLGTMLGVTLFGDYVRTRFAGGDGDRDLPRIPAHRTGVRLDAHWRGWEGELEWYRVGRQNDVAEFERSTSGYHMANLAVRYNGRFDALAYQLYAKANNLTDELAFSHTSFIKNAAPLTGRNLTVGVRVPF